MSIKNLIFLTIIGVLGGIIFIMPLFLNKHYIVTSSQDKIDHENPTKKEKYIDKIANNNTMGLILRKSKKDSAKVEQKQDDSDYILKYCDKDTLSLLQKLQTMFLKERDIEYHLFKVKKYLYGIYAKEKADALFTLYKKFLNMQMELSEIISRWPTPISADELLMRLDWVQDFRKEMLGEKLADFLYKDEIEKQKYVIKKEKIIHSDELYARDKELLLKELEEENQEIENQLPKRDDYVRYKETLALYKKDLSKLDEEEKREKINEIRRSIFPEEVVKRLEDADKKIHQFENKLSLYYEQKNQILMDPNIGEKEKEEKIEQLRSSLFGEDSLMIKRLDQMELARKQFLEKIHNKKSE